MEIMLNLVTKQKTEPVLKKMFKKRIRRVQKSKESRPCNKMLLKDIKDNEF
jgi:hypothetical protein